MGVRLAALFITLAVNIAIGFVIFFFMLIAMNGFHGNDAEKGLAAYIALAAIVSVAMGAGAFLATRFLMNKDLSGVAAVLIAVPIFSLVGGGLKIVCSIIGIAVADYVRVNS